MGSVGSPATSRGDLALPTLPRRQSSGLALISTSSSLGNTTTLYLLCYTPLCSPLFYPPFLRRPPSGLRANDAPSVGAADRARGDVSLLPIVVVSTSFAAIERLRDAPRHTRAEAVQLRRRAGRRGRIFRPEPGPRTARQLLQVRLLRGAARTRCACWFVLRCLPARNTPDAMRVVTEACFFFLSLSVRVQRYVVEAHQRYAVAYCHC